MKRRSLYTLVGAAVVAAAIFAAPASADIASDQADICARLDGDQSIDACTWVIRSGRWTGADLAGFYYNRGVAYGKKGLPDQAIADYTQAIALKPDFADAHFERGALYESKGLHDQAIADYTQVIALKPDFADAYDDRGGAYENIDLHDQAVADFSQAIALKPDFVDAYNGRAWSNHLAGRDAQALPDAEKAVSLLPSGWKVIDASALETRAEIYEKLGRRGEAIVDYRAALKIIPDLKSALDGLLTLGATP